MLKFLKSALNHELANWQLAIPVSVGCGVLVFFNIPFDPPLLISVISLLFTAAVAYLLRNKNGLRLIAIIAFYLALGFNAGIFRTEFLNTTALTSSMEGIYLTGRVQEFTKGDKGYKILLSNLVSKDIDTLPEMIKLTSKSKTEFKVGDIIGARVNLMPPPGPTMVGGFDYRTYAYFHKLGAIGYTISNIKVIKADTDKASILTWIERVRANIKSIFLSNMAAPYGAIAAGMLMGDASSIDTKTYEAIRTSGIAHIIAISGMHIVVIIGIIFFVLQAILAHSTYVATRYSVKKIAAMVAILMTFIYLIIAGNPVSAQRAFIMSSLTLIAIIMDRNASPMRSIGIAAVVLMLATPESILSASLQMSLAACLCLIATFDLSRTLCGRIGYHTYFRKALSYGFSVTLSTLTAGLATAPFIIYHFNQFSTYSILTNLIAIPLSDFVIMPLGLAAMLVMPLHLSWLFTGFLEKAIMLMVEYAKCISALPYASIYVPSLSNAGIISFALGGIMLCCMRSTLRFGGIFPVVFAILTINMQSKPDLLIDSAGKLFAIKTDDNKIIFSNKKFSRFTRKTWADHFGENEITTLKEARFDNCTNNRCIYEKGRYKIMINNTAECWEDYGSFDLAVMLVKESSWQDGQTCFKASNLITVDDLKNKGTHEIRITSNNINVSTTYEYQPKRKWITN